uniref:Capsid protein n=1 Tax=Torque teno Leptonychotes weddellii virus-1 TaxID=2012676 RepID=A0A1Z2RWH3_9VIRU|nr:ORF1 [Torque teno Leptonychotes weddellii virus 1]
MALRRRRRWRWPRRRRWRGGRRHLYRRRFGRHRYNRRWRRRHFGLRTASVRYYPSRRRKRISVRGWEPLGNVCSSSIASHEAEPYKDLDVDERDPTTYDGSDSNWQGTWGHHFFTIESLLLRSKYYFNYWSSDWEGYDYISFKGGWIWIPRMPYVSWMFHVDNSIQSNPNEEKPEDKYKNEKTWIHPGILLNRPGSKLMLSTAQAEGRPFFRKLRVVPPSAWEGNYRVDQALKFLLFHWFWTTCNMTSPFFDYFCSKQGGSTKNNQTCMQTPWFIAEKNNWEKMTELGKTHKDSLLKLRSNFINTHQDLRGMWVYRKKYLKSNCVNTPDTGDAVPSNFHNWGPFLPQNVLTNQGYEFSLYFRYKLSFKVSGDTLYRRLPSQIPKKGGLIPPAPGVDDGTGGEIQTRSILKKRPLTTSDILPGTLDESGILTERAYQRIVRSHRDYQSTRMGDEPNYREPSIKRVKFREPIGIRNRKRARQLIRILLGGRGESGGGGPPPGPPRREEPLDLLLNFPK